MTESLSIFKKPLIKSFAWKQTKKDYKQKNLDLVRKNWRFLMFETEDTESNKLNFLTFSYLLKPSEANISKV